ncbi:MAG: aminofutalosine synthase MqnE, partial [Flavisolibacter sp.]
MTEEVLVQAAPFQNPDPELQAVADKVYSGQRLSREDGLLLFQKGDLSFVGAMANHVREKLHGNNVYFNRNFHI